MSDIKPKLTLALETNHARRIRPAWTAKLSQVCGFDITPEHFLSLKETAILKKKFWSKIKSKDCCRRFYLKDSFGEIQHYLLLAASNHLVLFSSVDRYIGAVRLPAHVIFSRVQPIWDVVEEDLCVTTPDSQSGICVEFNHYDEHGRFIKEGVYELSTWGEFSGLSPH